MSLGDLCAGAGESEWRYTPGQSTGSELPEAQRLYTLAAEAIEQKKAVDVTFQRVGDVRAETPKTTGRPGDIEISRFLRLIELSHGVPWASATFDHNHAIILQLTASHLELLVDKKIAKAQGPRLRALIGQHTRDSNLVSPSHPGTLSRVLSLPPPHNLQVWITNRQQGW